MSKFKNNTADYGNWVPITMIKLMIGACFLFVVITLLAVNFINILILTVILSIITILMVAMTIYMAICRYLFAKDSVSDNLPNKENYIKMEGYNGVMGHVHHFLVEHLNWDGEGELIDIGCGSGSLTIRCAKKYPNAKLVGIDYWGKEWSYAKEQCEHNAQVEGVARRTEFFKGDASELDFSDETFDAAVSNFVFHEVKSQPDKPELIKEALRVVKKGGVFAFQDLFCQEKLYGDMDFLISQLKASGVSEIHYIPDVEKLGFIPKFVQTPWMLYGIGLIYGVK